MGVVGTVKFQIKIETAWAIVAQHFVVVSLVWGQLPIMQPETSQRCTEVVSGAIGVDFFGKDSAVVVGRGGKGLVV